MQKKDKVSESLAKSKKDIGWGHQIRSYVLQPYQLVKDLNKRSEVSLYTQTPKKF